MQNLPDRGSDEGPSLLNEAEIAPTSPPKQDSTDLLAGLSPASRRRCQKRLHMRRKRASMSGVTAIDDSLERLKPGRKKVKRSPSPKDGLQCDEDEGGSMLAPSMTQKRYPRAKRMALNELQDLGLAAEDLRKLGVDVLNPEGVAKMLKCVAYHSTLPNSFLRRPVYGTNCLETPLALVQGSQSKPSSYSTFMWSASSKTWLFGRSRSGNKNRF